MGTLIAALAIAMLLAVAAVAMAAARRPRAVEPEVGPPSQPRSDRSAEILERMSEGVIVFDESASPVMANVAARKLLGIAEERPLRKLQQEELTNLARQVIAGDDPGVAEIVVWFPERRSLRIHTTALDDPRGAVAILQDTTEEQRILRLRKEFVANASHELKSPVASLRALAEAVGEAIDDDPDAAAAFAHRVVQESERLSRLIVDLLDLSRLEEPSEIPRSEVSFTEVVEAETARALGDAAEKVIKIRTAIEPGIAVVGDDGHLALAVRNLIDNAVRYTPDGGQIEVGLRREDGEAVLRVADTGIGIPSEAKERIFERFYRVDKARARNQGGTGLGLAIVKHAVDLHNGSLSLSSEIGQGSTFEVRIPSSPAKEGDA